MDRFFVKSQNRQNREFRILIFYFVKISFKITLFGSFFAFFGFSIESFL